MSYNDVLTLLCIIAGIALISAECRSVKAKRKIKKLEYDLEDYKDFLLNNSTNCLNLINEDIAVSYVKEGSEIRLYVTGINKRSISDYAIYGEVSRVLDKNKKAKK